MKRLFSFGLAAATILLFQAGEMRGQSGVRLGITGGATVADGMLVYSSWLTSFYFPYTVTQSTRNGFAVGGILEVPLGEPLSLVVEPLYMQKGVTIDLFAQSTHEETAVYQLDYLQIPVTAMWRILPGALSPYVFAGPSVGFRLSAKVDEQIYVGIGETEMRQSGTRDLSEQFNGLDVALDVGGGLQYDLTGGGVPSGERPLLIGINERLEIRQCYGSEFSC